MHNRIATKAAYLFICLSLLLGACQPAPGPGAPSATPKNNAETSRATQTESTLIFDADAPLPPRVVERLPSGGEELPPDGAIRLAFDQPMDEAKTAAALEVVDPQGRAVTGKVDWANPRTLTFTPNRRLETGALYFASLETDAAAQNGLPLAEPYGFQFMTAADLQVSQVFPADGAQDVAADGVITVIFNRPVTPLVIAEERDKLPDPLVISPAIEGTGEWVNTSVYAFQPKDGLQSGTDYTVTVRAGLEDAAGETTLAKDYRWSFSTAEPGIEWFSLSDGRFNPQNGADKVLLDEVFTVQFLQPMDRESTEAAMSLTNADRQPAELKTEWKNDDLTLVITPTQRLALESTYTLRLDQSAQAATGGALSDGLEWGFTTLPKPQILSTIPADGETQSNYTGAFSIQFASPMRIDTVYSRIQISPKPKEEVQWYYNEWDWSMNGYFLEPSTEYEVRFLPGMEDIYGNRITTQTVIHFTTADREPYARLMMPYGAPMLRAGSPEGQEFYLAYSNVDSLSVELYSLSPDLFMRFQGGQANIYEYTPRASELVWKTDEQGDRQLNQRIVKHYQPETNNGDLLAPGFYLLGVDSPSIPHDNRFVDLRTVFVANANLTFKTSDGRGLAWLTDLESGKPLAGHPITVWDEHGDKLGEGDTDADGVATMDLISSPNSYSRFAIVNDGDVFGFASREWGSGASPYDYGIQMDYYAPADRPTVYVYTERPIYRPGQPVYFKGIVRMDDDLDYSIPDLKGVQIKINNYQETVYNQALTLSEYGSFDGKFILDNEAVLGYYTLDVDLNGDDSSDGSVTFSVAEYRKPEFRVSVEANPANLLAGENFTAVVQADYYSGGGVADAAVSWSLLSEPFQFNPPADYSGYTFSDFEEDVWGYHEDGEQGSQTVAQGEGRTDSSGRFTIELPADLSEFKTARRLTFEASITDVAQTSVSGRTSLVAHQSKVYPGIKAHSYVGKAGDEQSFDIVALNWDGKPLADQPLSVEIVERRWHSVQEQDANGRIEWKNSVEEIPAETFTNLVTDAQGKATVTFTPKKGGVYRAKVSSPDDLGNTGHASAFMWVAGDDFIPWQQSSDRGFNLVTDKKSYQPGETAEVLIASPFQGETYALVTVERGRVRSSEVVLLKTNSTVYKLPITPDLAPNAFISVMVVKGIDETNPRPSFKMGIARIEVDRRAQTLQVEVIPDREKVGPGEQVNYIVRTRDADGKPVQAELSLSLSDLATLSLLPPNSEPILSRFYANRDLGVWTSMSLVNSLEDYNVDIEDEIQEGQGAGSGGGGKGDDELGVIAVRQDFPDTALWEAHVVTGKNGEATVSVTLPDNLTTWRMDARAITLDTKVGQTTNDIVSTRPLLVRPQTPRFFIENDEAVLGTAVHNNTQETLTVNASLEGKGVELQDPAGQSIEIPAGKQAYVTWKAQVPAGTERVDLIFRAAAKGTLSGEVEDASRPPQGTLDNQGIPVYHYAAPETVGASGQMLEGGTKVEGILLPQSMTAYDAELTVKVAPSLAAGMTDGLTYLEHYPYECIEQTISRFLPNVLSTRALKAANLQDANLEAHLKSQVDVALQRLYSWQNPDGGWGWWKNNKSDPLTSAYVALGLYEAKTAGYTVSQPVLDSSLNYLRRQVGPLTGLRERWKVNRQAFILYVLAHAENPQVSLTVQLYEQRQRMATYALAYLTAALWEIDPDDPRLDTLLADFNSQAILSATGAHWEEKEVDRWNWNTDTRTTAIVLNALSRIDPENPLNANAVRWLMSNRTGGHWQGTQETAWTLMALTGWMEASGELQADYDYAVQLNGVELGSGVANKDTLRETQVFTVGFADLLKDELNRLAFARDDGAGNLYYTAHLEASLPVEQIAALDQGIIVSRSYYRQDDPSNPVTEAQVGELLLARLTIVAPYALHYVVIDDPLPAGLEAVDQSLSTSPQSVEVPRQYSLNDMWRRGWGWWFFQHIQYYDEKVVLSADYLPAGTYVYTYLVRAGTAGEFRSVPATALEFYFPEVYGRSAGGLFTVKP